MAGFCEHGDEPSGSIKCGKFLRRVVGKLFWSAVSKGCFSGPVSLGSFNEGVPELSWASKLTISGTEI